MRGLAARGSEAPSCDELEMTVRAIWDGEQPINHQFHTFVPSDWLARAAPRAYAPLFPAFLRVFHSN